MTLLLGIDLGTSAVKALLFDPNTSESLAAASVEYPLHRPRPGWAEQDPQDWWQATVMGVGEVLRAAGREDVVAIGFSGQMHGTVLLGEDGIPLHPAIIWADQRSAGSAQFLIEEMGEAALLSTTGTLPAAGFQAATLHWLVRHEPGLLARTERVLLPKDYLRYRMDGEVASDFSDAAGTGLFDILGRDWAWGIIAAAGLPESVFPPVFPATRITGKLTRGAADALGLREGTPIIAGCADQPAQALGNGMIAPGVASVTLGSGGQVFAPHPLPAGARAPALATDPRLHVFNHAVPDLLYVLGATLSAGLSLRWLRDVVGLGAEPQAYDRLSAEAAGVSPGADGLLFLPYLSGERTPHMDPMARGALIGLTSAHSRAHLARAVMEGVAFALRQALEVSLAIAGPVESVIAAGGGAASPVWREILAGVLGMPLRQTLLQEQSAVGAALLAGIGLGLYPDFPVACRKVVRYGPWTVPEPGTIARYENLYGVFKDLYPRLKADLHHLDGMSRTPER